MYVLTSLLVGTLAYSFIQFSPFSFSLPLPLSFSLPLSSFLDWNKLGYQILYGYSYAQIWGQRLARRLGFSNHVDQIVKPETTKAKTEIQVCMYQNWCATHVCKHVIDPLIPHMLIPIARTGDLQNDALWELTDLSTLLSVVTQTQGMSLIKWVPTSYKFLSVALTIMYDNDGAEDEQEQEIIIDLTPYYVVGNVINKMFIERVILTGDTWRDNTPLIIIDHNANLIQLFPNDSLTLRQHDYVLNKQ